MDTPKIRIRMEAYDHQVLDSAATRIVETVKKTGARVSGPVPLPTKVERYTVNRSPHVDKKSREQFEIRTHKRIIDIAEPTGKTMVALKKTEIPAGVYLHMKA
jgi:small subunit ribosomal protein S10